MTKANCTVPECEKPPRSSVAEYCEMHYYRLRRTGSTDRVRPWHRLTVCSVEGCDRPERYRQLCVMHNGRVERHGSTDLAPPNKVSGPQHPFWGGDDITYGSAHSRIRRNRGSASRYDCVDCGCRARDWSYQYTDPEQRESKFGPYSTDPAHYVPRCVSCHKVFDNRMWLELQ